MALPVRPAVQADRGTVFNVQRFSTSDGPGIRTTVFFKGCPLSCPWCHNPEGLDAGPQLMISEARCISCGLCAEACPQGCLPGRAAESCTLCGLCTEACPTGAREIVGRQWTVDEVLREVLKDRIFYDESGGGVTFSGGEPLSQPGFLLGCLEVSRAEGVHTALDTSGSGPRDAMIAAAAIADLVLFDLKLLDHDAHQRLLGAPLEPVLANLEALAGVHDNVWIRVPLIPGITDSDDNLAGISRLAASNPAVRRVCLLPYHRSGTAKRRRLQADNSLENIKPPSEARMTELAASIEAAGLEVSIGG